MIDEFNCIVAMRYWTRIESQQNTRESIPHKTSERASFPERIYKSTVLQHDALEFVNSQRSNETINNHHAIRIEMQTKYARRITTFVLSELSFAFCASTQLLRNNKRKQDAPRVGCACEQSRTSFCTSRCVCVYLATCVMQLNRTKWSFWSVWSALDQSKSCCHEYVASEYFLNIVAIVEYETDLFRIFLLLKTEKSGRKQST
jgi:hypothetical protein